MDLSHVPSLIICRASGLGGAFTATVVKSGGYAAIVDRNHDLGAAMEKQFGPGCRFFSTEIGDSNSIACTLKGIIEWISSTKAELGGILAAAGIADVTPAIDDNARACNMEKFDNIFRVNLRGNFDLACQTLPYWTARNIEANHENPDAERGAIVFVSSIVATEGQAGMSAYSGSKAAIQGIVPPMTRDLSKHQIRVLSIAPGHFESGLTRTLPPHVVASNISGVEFPRRVGNPYEFAALAKHLFENTYMNGTTIRIDGGQATQRSHHRSDVELLIMSYTGMRMPPRVEPHPSL